MRQQLVLALLLLSPACSTSHDCMTGDFSQNVQMDDDTLQRLELEWIRDAVVCRVGSYLVYSPADGDSEVLWIVRADVEPMYSVTVIGSDTLTVFQPSARVLAQFGNQDDDGAYRSVSYQADDRANNASISVSDFDLDGTADARSFYYNDTHTHRTQHRIADEWHDLVKRDGQYGYIVDGEFYAGREGKALLLERAGARGK